VNTLSVRSILWLVAVAFACHEAEEWNLASWLAVNFEPEPAFADRDARTLLVLFAVLGVSFTALSLWLFSLRGALSALLPLFAGVVLGNALTHIVWSVYLRSYAPGVATSVVLLVPLISYLLARVVRERLASPALLIACVLVAVVQPVGALFAGNTMSAPQLWLQRFGARLGGWLWGAA
jgi:hypothetical protein